MKSWILTFTNKIAVAVLVLALAGTFMLAVESAYAYSYGTEITKYDGIGTNGSGLYKEDNEAEPGMVQSQVWDLEGFFLKGKELTIIGGYNFYAGQEGMDAGDIFIDTDGNAVYSPNVIPGTYGSEDEVSNSKFKYDYVLDINWNTGKFDVIDIRSADSIVKLGFYGDDHNMPSNPWIYVSGGTIINTALTFNTYGKASQSNSDTGFLGWNGDNKHYVATFNISAIPNTGLAVFHNTMECGNDNLIGKAALVPEPSTLVLISAGLLGVGLVRRRILK